MTDYQHQPVMVREVVEAVQPRAGGVYADATVGGGGHALAVLEASAPDGRLIALDRDPAALEASRTRLHAFRERLTLRHGTFSDLPAILVEEGASCVDGLVADLGVSSPQLDRAERGFSFSRSGPLDMRMDPTRGETAHELIGKLSEQELADVLYQLSEERRSRKIARCIRAAYDRGELNDTESLRAVVRRAVGARPGQKIDPATRTFQALRMAVNKEREQLDTLLGCLPRVLTADGVAVIISFHSVEDRMVKWAFRQQNVLQPLTKKPVRASREEVAHNPRSRSAKLRAARRLEAAA